ncbi:MAG: TolC family protein, partial [Alphaproteobacteria bacterium]|nr:TolC family protein [Alphaproteobacteria bacterium]
QTNVRGQAPQSVSQLSFQVIQPLLAGGGVGFGMAPVRIARISESNAQLRLKGSVIDQITAIITAYRNLVQTQEQLRIAEASLRRARDLLEVNRALIAAGRIAQIELIQSEASIAQQELSLTAARNANEGARLALLLLMALDPASRIWASERPSADSVRVELPLALEAAYNNQPAYLQSLLAIEISRIQLDVARNQRLWEVNLVAGAGPQASGLGRELVDTIGALGRVRSDFNIGLQVNIPIGQLRREQGEVNATVALRQTELAAEQARDRLRQQVEDAVRNLEAQRRQAELARRSRELVAQQLQAELARLQAGRSSNFQVVSFQSQLQNAESAELGAVIGYVNALTTLDQVLGTTLDTWRITLNPP